MDPQATWLIYEDRASGLPGLDLCLASMRRQWPDCRILLYSAKPELIDRLGAKWGCEVRARTDVGGDWNIKPFLLLDLIEEFDRPIHWMDSDIVLTGRPPAPWPEDPSIMVITQEPRYPATRPSDARVRAFGLEVGRTFQTALNTGMLRVSRAHRSLLERWAELLSSSAYRQAASVPFPQRPSHLQGGQAVLLALVASTEFSDVPLHVVPEPWEICQLHPKGAGYSLGHCWRGFWGRRRPAFVHALGVKPWTPRVGWRKQCNLYTWAARRLRDRVDAASRGWMEPLRPFSRLVWTLTAGNPHGLEAINRLTARGRRLR